MNNIDDMNNIDGTYIPVKIEKPNNKIYRVEKKLLHYTGKAIADYKLISKNDKILVCLSGGKDSFTMLSILKILQIRAKLNFEIFVLIVDQSNPGWNKDILIEYLQKSNINFEIIKRDIYSVVREKVPQGKSYCSLCSRLRRGNIYQYAKENGYNKIALGHHRDDLIQTLLMSILYSGEIRSMPPKLLTDKKDLVVIRPLVYCQEKDIALYAKLKTYPIITCDSFCMQINSSRKKIAKLILDLAKDNPKIPSNILHALKKVTPSHLMDPSLWDFENF